MLRNSSRRSWGRGGLAPGVLKCGRGAATLWSPGRLHARAQMLTRSHAHTVTRSVTRSRGRLRGAHILDLRPELLVAEPQGPGDALQVVDEHAGRKGGREGPAAGGSNRATRASPEDEASAWSPGQGLLPSPTWKSGSVTGCEAGGASTALRLLTLWLRHSKQPRGLQLHPETPLRLSAPGERGDDRGARPPNAVGDPRTPRSPCDAVPTQGLGRPTRLSRKLTAFT